MKDLKSETEYPSGILAGPLFVDLQQLDPLKLFQKIHGFLHR